MLYVQAVQIERASINNDELISHRPALHDTQRSFLTYDTDSQSVAAAWSNRTYSVTEQLFCSLEVRRTGGRAVRPQNSCSSNKRLHNIIQTNPARASFSYKFM
jgi:hypothetical protein